MIRQKKGLVTAKGYTKHYFEEGRRVCSKIGGGFRGRVPTEELETRVKEMEGLSFRDQFHHQQVGVVETFGNCIGVRPELIDRYDILQMLMGYRGNEKDFFCHSDHLGSAAYLTTGGQVTQTLNYLPYGEDWVDIRNNLDPNLGQYTFTGKEKDEETGFGYFGARYMDHELMTMWLSVDPMADKYPSISPYAYCAWNPIRLTDPNGCDIDTASVPAKMWNMVNPQHECYNAEFADVFNQLATENSTIFSFNEWSEPEIDDNAIIRGRLSLIESTVGHPDKISIGFLWGEEGLPVAPERYLFEEVYHAKQFLDGEFGYGYAHGIWGLMGFDLFDEEDAHRWADRVSGSPNSWTQEAIDYYKIDRGLPDSRRNVTEHYMNHDGIKRTHPPKYDQNGIYKTDIRTMRKPKN